MRSDIVLKAEADLLEAMKPKVRPRTMFGESNHAAIDAQIRVLREKMSEDEIYQEFGEEDEDIRIIECAMEAFHWMEGDECDVETPSIEWRPLLMEP